MTMMMRYEYLRYISIFSIFFQVIHTGRSHERRKWGDRGEGRTHPPQSRNQRGTSTPRHEDISVSFFLVTPYNFACSNIRHIMTGHGNKTGHGNNEQWAWHTEKRLAESQQYMDTPLGPCATCCLNLNSAASSEMTGHGVTQSRQKPPFWNWDGSRGCSAYWDAAISTTAQWSETGATCWRTEMRHQYVSVGMGVTDLRRYIRDAQRRYIRLCGRRII